MPRGFSYLCQNHTHHQPLKTVTVWEEADWHPLNGSFNQLDNQNHKGHQYFDFWCPFTTICSHNSSPKCLCYQMSNHDAFKFWAIQPNHNPQIMSHFVMKHLAFLWKIFSHSSVHQEDFPWSLPMTSQRGM